MPGSTVIPAFLETVEWVRILVSSLLTVGPYPSYSPLLRLNFLICKVGGITITHLVGLDRLFNEICRGENEVWCLTQSKNSGISRTHVPGKVENRSVVNDRRCGRIIVIVNELDKLIRLIHLFVESYERHQIVSFKNSDTVLLFHLFGKVKYSFIFLYKVRNQWKNCHLPKSLKAQSLEQWWL